MSEEPKADQTASAVPCRTLSAEAREDLRKQARRKALEIMTEAEWEKRRADSGDPVRADVEMAFGPMTE